MLKCRNAVLDRADDQRRHISRRKRGRNIRNQLAHAADQLGGACALQLGEDGVQHNALTLHACPVIAGVALADTTVAQRLHAVQRLQAGLLHAGELLAPLCAVILDDTVELLQLVIVLHVDVHAADRVYDLHQLLEVYGNVILDIRAEILVDGADSQTGTAAEIRRIQLVLTVAVDIYQRIAHQADELDLAARVVHGDDHHAVRMALLVALAGIQTEQCNIRNIFVRCDARRQIFIGQRGVIGIAEHRAVAVQSDAEQDCQRHNSGHRAEQCTLQAFERHSVSPRVSPRKTSRSVRVHAGYWCSKPRLPAYLR